jgi:transcriptional regulator of acetoin/glycerol metabolism
MSIELPSNRQKMDENQAASRSELSDSPNSLAFAHSSGPVTASDSVLVGKDGPFSSLPELEQHVITGVYRECQGNLSLAARTLGIPRSTLRDRLKKYGINPPASQKRVFER